MASKFHRWWLGACVAALLLASWAGGFSVAVTAVFVVIYLTGVTLVGPEDEADIGLAAGQAPPARHEPEPAVVAKSVPEPAPVTAGATPDDVADDDAEPYPDDEPDAAQDRSFVVAMDSPDSDAADTAAVVVESAGKTDAAIVVETASETDTTAVVDIMEADDAEQTGALIIEKPAEDTQPSADPA